MNYFKSRTEMYESAGQKIREKLKQTSLYEIMKWPFIIAAIIATLLFGSSIPLMIILILGIIK